MEAKDQNYGVTGEVPEEKVSEEHAEDRIEDSPEERAGDHGATGIATQEERTWSAVSHLTVFLNLFTGFLGPVAAFVIWLVYKDKSPTVAFHALQSAAYQVAWLVLLGAGWVLTGLLTLILIGFLLIPVMAVATVVPFVHMAYAAYRVSKGDDYRYPLVADLIQAR